MMAADAGVCSSWPLKANLGFVTIETNIRLLVKTVHVL